MSNVQILTFMPKKIEFMFRKNKSSTHRVQKILVDIETKEKLGCSNKHACYKFTTSCMLNIFRK